MAFNPFTTFQKNRRFWMAMILMVCMVSFVFCGGMKGGIEDLLITMGRSRGPAVATVAGRSVTVTDLQRLKEQRNLANEIMVRCTERAFQNVSKYWHDLKKKQADPKEAQKRQREEGELQLIRSTLVQYKARPRFFESGTKFDELLEFKLWQAKADQMGIRLEPQHIAYMFDMEFFNIGGLRTLSDDDVRGIYWEARRNFHNANNSIIQRAIGEEFRVRIAQLAVMGVQPSSMLYRVRRQGEAFVPKYLDPNMPDEIRSPMTLAQLWDYYKTKRAEFEVTLIPVPVKYFVNQVGEPTLIDKRDFFNANKNKPFDPTTGVWGLEIPTQAKIEYLMADPNSPAYLGKAQALWQLETTPPFVGNPMQSPLVLAARYVGEAQAEKTILQGLYDALGRTGFRYAAAPFYAADCESPLLARVAMNQPQAIASMMGRTYLSPLDPYASLSGFLAWGTVKEKPAVDAAIRFEVQRRGPVYATVIASGFANSPLTTTAFCLSMDKWYQEQFSPTWQAAPLSMPLAIVEKDLRNMFAERKAEEWARADMKKIKTELEEAADDPEKIKRVLNKNAEFVKRSLFPANKDVYYNRFTISEAKEFEPFKEAYLRYVDRINLFEGRDTTPEKKLTPGDFYKLFFDSSEPFSATALNRVMAWPPSVTPAANQAMAMADPRNMANVNADIRAQLQQHMDQVDPTHKAPAIDLFNTAEKPILFWKTAELPPWRPSDYDKIDKEISKNQAALEALKKDLAAAPDDEARRALTKKRDDLQQTDNDLKEIQNRITEGWKFERARASMAIPEAAALAKKLISRNNDPEIIKEEAEKLREKPIVLKKVSQMPTEVRTPTDRFKWSLPKDVISYPRDDMAQAIVSLQDLKKPIELNLPELDRINKELFDLGKRDNHFVQILTNRPRSIFYIALVSRPPLPEPFLRFGFRDALILANNEPLRQHDYFVGDAQQEEAKRWRAGVVRDLERVLGFTIENESARKEFDDKVAGD